MKSNTPEFIRHIRSVWLFETTQLMKIRIFDVDTENDYDEDVKRLIGETTFHLSKLFETHHNRVLTCDLFSSSHQQGSLEIRVDTVVENRDYVNIQFSCNLKNTTNIISAPKPFLVFKRINEDRSWTKVMSYMPPDIGATLTPDFRTLKIPLPTICNGDVHCPLLLQVYDRERDHRHDLIGQIETSIQSLIDSNGQQLFLTTVSGVNAGTIAANNASLIKRPTPTDVRIFFLIFFLFYFVSLC
jgi:hypothetical protein